MNHLVKSILFSLVLICTWSCKKGKDAPEPTTDTGPAVITVSTLAGSGIGGFADGAGISAQFKSPYGIAVDANGNLFVGDYLNNCIRKITPVGVVSTLAGSVSAGFINATGSAARFNGPLGVAADANGNIYVADQSNHCIRKIAPDGVVSTIAGSGVAGFADGTGTSAQFNHPGGVAIDDNGNLYVDDFENNRIRKITSNGVVSTLAGSGVAGFTDGTGPSAQFDHPRGITVDGNGNIYVADFNNHRIRKITPAGVVSSLAGSGIAGFADGTGTSAQFNYPRGLAVDADGNLFVADYSNHIVRKITSDGVVSTLAGTRTGGFVEGTGESAQFNYPTGIAVDASGNLYVADFSNHRIRKIVIP